MHVAPHRAAAPRPVGVVAIGYAVPRFFLDFLLRELSDPRYAGFTPAQWSCLATIAAAVALFAWIYRRERRQRYSSGSILWRSSQR